MTTTASRLLQVLGLLQSRPEWTGPEIAERLGVSVRTVRRDIDRLRELGYVVPAGRGSDGGYRLAAGATLPPLLLEDDEAVAIVVGLRTSGLVGETGLRALAKLEQVLPNRLRRRVSALNAATTPLTGPSAGPFADPEILSVLAAACRDSERVRFRYSGESRLVEPHGLVSASRRWYLVAWDTGRADWRTYRVDRMSDLRATGVRTAPRELPAPDAATFVARSLARSKPVYQAVLTVHAPASEVADRIRTFEGELEPVDDHTCRLRTAVDSLDWIALRIAFLGVDFRVEEPPELVGHLRELAHRLLRAAEPRPRPQP